MIFDEALQVRRPFKPLISLMLLGKFLAMLRSFSGIAIYQVGSLPKRWAKALSLGADGSLADLDVFFAEDDFGLSAVLFLSVFFEVVLLGRDLLA